MALEQSRYGQLLRLIEQATAEGLYNASQLLSYSLFCLRNPRRCAPAARVELAQHCSSCARRRTPHPWARWR